MKNRWERASRNFYLTIIDVDELQNRVGPRQLNEVTLPLPEHPRGSNPLDHAAVREKANAVAGIKVISDRKRCAARDTSPRWTRDVNLSMDAAS